LLRPETFQIPKKRDEQQLVILLTQQSDIQLLINRCAEASGRRQFRRLILSIDKQNICKAPSRRLFLSVVRLIINFRSNFHVAL